MNLNELPDMSDALRQVYEGKKKPELDPVGKEDGDIDNDGKKNDPNDKYLANRRKAIAKAMKKEEVEEVEEGMKQARKNVGADTCWDGYKAKGTKKKNGKEVPNCVKEDELEEAKKGLYANIHAKRKRGESPAKPGDEDYPAKDAFKKAEKTAKKEAFYFDAEEFEGLEAIDEMTDEELIDTMMEAIVELAEDDEDLLEIAEALEGVELLDEEVEQLDELLGGIAGGLMNMGKKGGFMKGASTGIGGLAGQAMGKKPTMKGFLGFSKGGKVKKSVAKESVEGIAEALSHVHEVSDKYYDSAVKSSKEASRGNRAARMKGAAKEAGKRVKAGAAAGMKMVKPAAKAAAKGAAKGAGYAVGAAQRGGSSLKKSFSAGYKRGKEGAPGKKEAPKGDSKPASKKDDDGTGGKLDSLLASTRGTKGSSSGGGSSSASSGGGESEAPKAKKPGLLSRIGKGLKRAVGKTARAVSGGSDKLAKRLGEDYDEIAHLYETGLFTLTEIENVIEGVRDDKTAERKERLEKKRGMKLDDHPEYKKEELLHDLSQLSEEQLDEILGYVKNAAMSGKMKGTPAGKAFAKASPKMQNSIKNVGAAMGGGTGRRSEYAPGSPQKAQPTTLGAIKQNFTSDQMKTGGKYFKGYMTGKGPGSNFNASKFLTGKSAGGKVKKEEVGQIDEISADLALTASQKADDERRKASLSGDRERASKKAKQASNLYKGVGKRRAKERMNKEEK